MLRLFIRDNENGAVHEYGTDRHDALLLRRDGSLQYENLQNGDGTSCGGYSFCLEDGSVPDTGSTECDPYVDIGGEYNRLGNQ